MPHMLRRPLPGALLVALALAALPASARADLVELDACDDAPLSRPFARWGDDSLYKLVPAGDVEGDLTAWSLRRGARQAPGSEPYAATGEQGRSSLTLPAGASATAPATCVNAGHPSFRFFARSSGGLLGLLPALSVELVYSDGAAGLLAIPIGVVGPSSSWRPSAEMFTASVVGATLAGGEAPLALRFTALAGTWQVDDVFVDPYKRN